MYGRRGQGTKITNNDVKGFRNAMSSALVRAAHSWLWKFVEGNMAKQIIEYIDVAEVNSGGEKQT